MSLEQVGLTAASLWEKCPLKASKKSHSQPWKDEYTSTGFGRLSNQPFYKCLTYFLPSELYPHIHGSQNSESGAKK